MRRRLILFLLLILLSSLAWSGLALAQNQPVVRAVLFYSPTCPHCHKVLQNDLPPLVQKYGDQLQILLIDVTTQGGRELYLAAAQALPIPEEKRGVPALVVGDQLLVGDVEIPEKFPGLIEQGLAAGGVDWPDIPGLDRVIQQLEAQKQATPSATSQAPQTPAPTPESASLNQVNVKSVSEMSVAERLALDPVGSAIAIFTLVVMVGMLAWALIYWARSNLTLTWGPRWLNGIIPLLSLAGAGIAFYLAFVETTGTRAVCGPVGDCNAVQQSDYAVLFGILPVGVLGFIGYLVILGLWAWQYAGPPARTEKTAWMLPAIVYFGTVFSTYLTFLEPFVIGAVCMWCITSAWIMTLLLFLTFRWRIPPRRARAS